MPLKLLKSILIIILESEKSEIIWSKGLTLGKFFKDMAEN